MFRTNNGHFVQPQNNREAPYPFKRRLTNFLSGILWRMLREYGVTGPILPIIRLLDYWSESVVHISHVWADLLYSGKSPLCHHFCSQFSLIEFQNVAKGSLVSNLGVQIGPSGSLLFADDLVPLTSLSSEFQHTLWWFVSKCIVHGIRVSTTRKVWIVIFMLGIKKLPQSSRLFFATFFMSVVERQTDEQ